MSEGLSLITEIDFEAAHFLPYYDGKCRNMHGHTYKWVVQVCNNNGGGHISPKSKVDGVIPVYRNDTDNGISSTTGMIMDFKVLKEHMEDVVKHLDHSLLNNTVPYPTAENIILYLVTKLQSVLGQYGVVLVSSKLWETRENCVEWRRSAWII